MILGVIYFISVFIAWFIMFGVLHGRGNSFDSMESVLMLILTALLAVIWPVTAFGLFVMKFAPRAVKWFCDTFDKERNDREEGY